jgi:D-alanyl-lipoteichoic acid acyltransferase DltB (MBOAT superfamily)
MIPTDLTLPSLFNWLIESSLYIKGKPLFSTDGFFVVFLFLFLLTHTIAASRPRIRLGVILFFSLWFYYKSAGILILVLLFTALFSYLAGRLIGKTDNKKHQSLLLLMGVVVNVATLAFFKYSPFYEQFSALLSTFSLKAGAILFPVGLSFYTFSNLSYLVDVKRGKTPAESSFPAYLAYIAFFPTVQMGPIERAGNILPYWKTPLKLSREDIGEGFYLVLSGAIKKMVIGDFINHHLVTNIFSAPDRFTGMENLAAVLGYALVIYYDFSGYTDMARGFARWMGIRIGLNFNLPYKSWNIGEFWRRWHISLSSWLRDYIFMPLAFSLSSAWKQEYLIAGKFLKTDLLIFTIASLITFFICGIWHGTGINFLIWGVMHGTALSIQKIWSVSTKSFRKNRSAQSRKFNRAIGILLTFLFVSVSWVFFRMETPEKSLLVFAQISGNFAASAFPLFVEAYYPVLLMMTLGYLLHFAPEKIMEMIKIRIISLSWPLKTTLSMMAVLIIYYFQSLGSGMPIYIQF